MSFLNNVFGVHEHAIALRDMRTSILASNIANVDTPHYRARDIDFRSLINSPAVGQLRTSHALHLKGPSGAESTNLKYRVPSNPSIDGNTVESDVENNLFAENSMRYQATLTFLNNRIKGVMTAFKGE